MTVSPYISICRTDPITGYCYGCGRSNDDKIKWKDSNTTDGWKIENLNVIRSRMTGWQLNSFNESYNHKVKSGTSLFKKNNQK